MGDTHSKGCVILKRLRSPRTLAVAIAAAGGLTLAAPTAAFASSGSPHHQSGDLKLNQVNLASDIPGKAPLTDPDLKNPWGISFSPTSPLWVSNQGTNSSTLYTLTPGSGTRDQGPAGTAAQPGGTGLRG